VTCADNLGDRRATSAWLKRRAMHLLHFNVMTLEHSHRSTTHAWPQRRAIYVWHLSASAPGKQRRGGHGKCGEAATYIMVPRGMFGITLIHVDTVYLMGTLDSDLCPRSHADSEKRQQCIYIFDECALCFQSRQDFPLGFNCCKCSRNLIENTIAPRLLVLIILNNHVFQPTTVF